ncbi:hypothetical protein [Methanosarcina sp. MSH10X1]|uniref:hypothetical protein n=1 Tax=Methanosarcina sp. MSH10X1 TaxID=2507075 RepID=UPI0013E32916|nr:hypothetical protein [Methanosarcina sp. MSH10X1]
MKRRIAQKENSRGIIPIFKETLTASSQCFDTGRKSLSKSSKSKTAVATDAPSGIPGITVAIESAPEETELEIVKLVSVIRTPRVD